MKRMAQITFTTMIKALKMMATIHPNLTEVMKQSTGKPKKNIFFFILKLYLTPTTYSLPNNHTKVSQLLLGKVCEIALPQKSMNHEHEQ